MERKGSDLMMFLLAIIPLCVIGFLLSWYYLAEGSVSTTVEQITIWGKSAIWDRYIPGEWIVGDYGFGAGFYPAIKPLFILCIIFTFVGGVFIFSNEMPFTLLHWGNFIIVRFFRILHGAGGILGIISFAQFSKFIKELNEKNNIYHLAWSFYLGLVVFSIITLNGCIRAFSKIKTVKPKTTRETTKIAPLRKNKDSQVQQKTSEEELAKDDPLKINPREKVD